MKRHIQDFTGFSVNEAKAPEEGVDRKKIKKMMIDVFSKVPNKELVGYLDGHGLDELSRMHDRLMDDLTALIKKGRFEKALKDEVINKVADIFSKISNEDLIDYLDDKMVDELGRLHDGLMDDLADMIDRGKFDNVKTKEDAEKAIKRLKGKF